jgi:hypothetical protein
MIANGVGDEIVQLGRKAAGDHTRWGFYEITPASFLWVGEVSADGAVWKRVVEFRARRR